MIEIKEYNNYPRVVFVDGYVIPKQTLDGSFLSKSCLCVPVFSDERVHNFDYSKIRYQIKDPIVLKGGNTEVSILQLDCTKIQNPQL